jgi:16S rRNA (uracil1498-N3)-methyltransferase
MTTPRFFIPTAAVDGAAGRVFHQDVSLCQQITRVLRLKQGSQVDLLDGSGKVYSCTLESASNGKLLANIDSVQTINDPLRVPVHIALPVLKGGRFEWALEKLTELGVAKISPIVVRRSVVKPHVKAAGESLDESSQKLKRWQTILKESSEQCERATIPQLVPPLDFDRFVSTVNDPKVALKIICAERRIAPHLGSLLGNFNQLESGKQIVIAVGAEGGFTDAEVEQAVANDFAPACLGPSILRSETAAIYALAIVASSTALLE